MKNREYGSDFSFLPELLSNSSEDGLNSIFPKGKFYFSGRSALYHIIHKGIIDSGWKNFHIPEYYCHEVTDFISRLSINIKYYKYGPYTSSISMGEGADSPEDVYLFVNYFGLSQFPELNLQNAVIIEDHTHDLTSSRALNSKADYCFSSLRKIVPIPNGGIAWSPKGLDIVEPNSTDLADKASFMKLAAMLLKKNYLDTGELNKDFFRKIYGESEEYFGDIATNGSLSDHVKQLIFSISINNLNFVKRENLILLEESIIDKSVIFKISSNVGGTKMGLILFFDEIDQKLSMQKHLISHNIFPAVLWPNQKTPDGMYFSKKMLFIHTDIRYSANDMVYIAHIINSKL